MSAFETSPSTEKLDAVLAKVQGQLKTAVRESSNPHLRTTYADLTSTWSACREALSVNGVSVTQWPIASEDGCLHLVTRLAHAGEWMKSECSIPMPKQDPQGFGAALSYARRYALSAAVGIVSDDDDDGESQVSRMNTVPRPEPEKPNPFQASQLEEALRKVGGLASMAEADKLAQEFAKAKWKGEERKVLAAAFKEKRATLGPAPVCPECGSKEDQHKPGCPMTPTPRQPGQEG